MTKNIQKIAGSLVLISLLTLPTVAVRAQGSANGQGVASPKVNAIQVRLDNPETQVQNRLIRANTTEKRLENRENNIEKIRERLNSMTASTSEQRLDKINERLSNQIEQMNKVRTRLQGKELKITDLLGQIASKIQARINILEERGLDMTNAKEILATVSQKIEDMTIEASNLATLINTEITDTNSNQLFTDIKISQNKIKSLAYNVHLLMTNTIKEITKVLPAKNATTTPETN